MPLGFISYSADNDKSFSNQLQRAFSVTDDLTKPFQIIANDFYRSEKAIFKLKGPGQYPAFKNSSGEVLKIKHVVKDHGILKFTRKVKFRKKDTYVTLSKSPYQTQKIKKYGFDYPLLKASGALEGSVTSSSSSGSIYINDGKFLAIGTSIPYAIYHQSDDPRHKIPLRKFLFIGPESSFANNDQMGRLKRWNNALNNYILRQMNVELGNTK